jgi:hypothetical protein
MNATAVSSRTSTLVGPGIALAGVLVSATIGFASWQNSRAQYSASMAPNFYDRIGAEEAFWKQSLDDYLATFDERMEQRPEWRRERLIAIFELARTREIPSFREFGRPPAQSEYANKRLEHLKGSLYSGLDERAAEDPVLRAELVKRGFGNTVRREKEPPRPTAVPAAPPANPSPSPVLTAAISGPMAINQSLSAPTADAAVAHSLASPSGWDLDVFWCRGDRQDENYRRADALAREFGALASAGRAIAPGVRLGRVRSRPATIAYQGQPGSAARQSWVVADSSPGEAEAAAAVRDSANALLGQPLIGAGTSTGAPTRWYLSLFLCGSRS